MTGVFPDLLTQTEPVRFTPTRAAGLRRLDQVAARTGRHYARTRNFDFGDSCRSNVSALSPWIRHRLVTEEEVLTRVLALHGPKDAEKFVQEVFWRTYFKGWLEQRPSVWTGYQTDLIRAQEAVAHSPAEAARLKAALGGETGIDCFDHWVAELRRTGYLHNHARMWFASIWIFTLRLPWQLGADFFLRHLLDGDPASNTLSWRWVGGVHTKGKTYLARPDNIAKFTEGRFAPKGLATVAEPLTEQVDHPVVPLREAAGPVDDRYLLLLTEEDLTGPDALPQPPEAVIGIMAGQGRSPNPVGAAAQGFATGAMNGALPPGTKVIDAQSWASALQEAATQAGVTRIVTPYAPVGPSRARLDQAEPQLTAAGLTLTRIMRPYDRIGWPHAKAGYFALKKKIPSILTRLALTT